MKAQTLYVIYAKPENYRGPSTYLDREENRTKLRIEAVAFYTDFDARAFAHEMSIDLTKSIPYIGAERYPAHEEPFIWMNA